MDLLDTIRVLGRLLDGVEHVRVQNGNRIAALERDYGGSLPHLDVIQKQLKVAEHLAELELKRAWRNHPLAAWAKEQRGVGEKSTARLIAEVGDPADRPNVAKLWAYCGHGNPHLKKHRGMTQEQAFMLGNPRAKKQVWMVATSMLKAGNREGYDAARAHYAEREWTDGHKHAAALRKVGKEFLRDLWVAARAGHRDIETQLAGARAGHPSLDTHFRSARAGQFDDVIQTPRARAGEGGTA